MKSLMKKLVVCLLCLMMLISMVACSSQEQSSEPTDNAAEQSSESASNAEEKTYKIAALLPGSINDGGWSTLGYNAAKNAAEKYGQNLVTSKFPAADVLEAAEDYAQRGFDLVFGHSTDYQDTFKLLINILIHTL